MDETPQKKSAKDGVVAYKKRESVILGWMSILYLTEITNTLGFNSYPMDIILLISKIFYSQLFVEITTENAIVSTVTPSFPAESVVQSPSGILIENENDKGFFKVLVAEYGGHVISRVSVNNETREITRTIIAGSQGVAGSTDGILKDSRLHSPIAMCFDEERNIIIADCGNHTIRRLNEKEGKITTIAGIAGQAGLTDGKKGVSQFSYPADVFLDRGHNLIIVDSGNSQIRKITQDGMVTTLKVKAGKNESKGSFEKPRSAILGLNNDIIIADFGNHNVKRLTNQNKENEWILETIAGSDAVGYKDGIGKNSLFSSPFGCCMDEKGNIFVSDWGNNNIRKIDTETQQVTTIAGTKESTGTTDGEGIISKLCGPCGIKFDSNGDLYISDYQNNRIRRITPK